MPDVYTAVRELDSATQERIAGVLETRGADPEQQAMRRAFLEDLVFPDGARVLEVGCGTGVLTRTLARWPGVATVVGVDPAPFLLERAKRLAGFLQNASFLEASYDVIVFDSTLSHVPQPDRALGEAFRVLRAGGALAVFDGDYATAIVALGDDDPLQRCVDATMHHSVHDRWLVRRLPTLVQSSGFELVRMRGHSFVETSGGEYMLSVVDRGADILCTSGGISASTADALKSEARRRRELGLFFGHIGYGSIYARKA